VSTKPPKILDPIRVRLRRLQFTMGLGFIALVIGSVFTGSFTLRVYERAQELPYVLYVLLAVVLSNLWLLGVLPLLAYGAARVLELRPMSTAVGAAFTGQFFVLAVQTASGGTEALWSGWLPFAMQVAAFVGGVLLTYRSVLQGRAAAAKGVAQVQAKAEARKSEYEEFLREAEKAGEKAAQREAERTTPAVASPAGAPASAPEPVSVAATEAPTVTSELVSPAPTETQVPAEGSEAPSPAPAPESAEPKASTGS
jgi:hypothetical protein